MPKLALPLIFLAAFSAQASAADGPIRFWNLTAFTIKNFSLAPTGSDKWGINQCQNDRDGTVDPDERLRITGIEPGVYDAKLTDVNGRQCVVKSLKIEAGAIFSIEEKELTSCQQ